MKTVPVAEIQSNLSTFLKEVESGNEIGISLGALQPTIAVIVPFTESKRVNERKLGMLDGKVNVTFADDFKMSEEEFLGLQ